MLLATLALFQGLDLTDLLPEAPHQTRLEAFAALTAEPDERYIAPLLDLLSLAETAEEWYRILDALSAITGEPQRDTDRPWRTNSLRLADTPDRELPPNYLAFKRELYATQLSPEFRRFLNEAQAPIPHLDEVVFGGVAPGDIPALDHPEAVPAAESALPDHAPVLGIAVGGEARAYPNRILDWHELANDTLGGQSFALTWCTLCGAAIAYDITPTFVTAVAPIATPEPLTFDTSGLLFRSNKLMFDSATDSLWNQLTGEAFSGPMAKRGARLTMLPVVHTTFGRWRAEHPDTTVVSSGTGHDRDYTEGAAYGDYFASTETMFPTPRLGQQFAPKERIVVLQIDQRRQAISLDALEPEGVLHFELSGQRIALFRLDLPTESRLPLPWREALEAVHGDASFPTPDSLRQAATQLGSEAPPLTEEDLRSLPRATRRAVLTGDLTEIPLADGARAAAAVAHLLADVRAVEAPNHTFHSTEDPNLWADETGSTWRWTSSGLTSTAEEGPTLPQRPTHLAYGFAADASAWHKQLDQTVESLR